VNEGRDRKAEETGRERFTAALIQHSLIPPNPAIHRKTNWEEIWNDTDGKVGTYRSGIGHRRHDHGLSERLLNAPQGFDEGL